MVSFTYVDLVDTVMATSPAYPLPVLVGVIVSAAGTDEATRLLSVLLSNPNPGTGA